ncbi:hypothetical protein [Burkholderia stagnalis]|uniref:hypothetical protein n=1 Tax=Burkholderia stagnalis TaxID=1503054 RepID=UPI0009C13D29|nr:hypothetical protein [Burkholderia stagnalis]
MQQAQSGVLYVYRCSACQQRGEMRRPDDTHDGERAICPKCGSPVELEWDGGVTLEVAPRSVPTLGEIRSLRLGSRRTQGQMARLLHVTERQYQRWEAGASTMPLARWQLLQRIAGQRHPADFAPAPVPTRGWDTRRDSRRDTIERGDVVELQPLDGPLLRATVCLDRVHDGLADEDGYGALVTEFVGAANAGQEFQGFFIGERVTFARANVMHLEQRAPRAARRMPGA